MANKFRIQDLEDEIAEYCDQLNEVPMLRVRVKVLEAELENWQNQVGRQDIRIKEQDKVIAAFQEEFDKDLKENEFLHERIDKLEAERDELQRMLVSSEPPYYTKWKELVADNKRLREVTGTVLDCIGGKGTEIDLLNALQDALKALEGEVTG